MGEVQAILLFHLFLLGSVRDALRWMPYTVGQRNALGPSLDGPSVSLLSFYFYMALRVLYKRGPSPTVSLSFFRLSEYTKSRLLYNILS